MVFMKRPMPFLSICDDKMKVSCCAKTQVRQQGVVLLSMLMIFALVAAIAAKLIYEQYEFSLQVHKLQARQQAFEYARSGEGYVKLLLFNDWQTDTRSGSLVDDLSEPWNLREPPFEPQSGRLLIRVLDENGKININNMLDPEAAKAAIHQQIFRRFLEERGIEEGVAEVVIAYLETLAIRPQGEVPSAKAEKNPAIGGLVHVTQIRDVATISREDMQFLLRYATTLPTLTSTNINTVSDVALRAIYPNAGNESVYELRQAETRFESVAEFLQSSVSAGLPDDNVNLAVTSEFFEVHILAEFAGTRVYLLAKMHRHPDDGVVTVYAREILDASNYGLDVDAI